MIKLPPSRPTPHPHNSASGFARGGTRDGLGLDLDFGEHCHAISVTFPWQCVSDGLREELWSVRGRVSLGVTLFGRRTYSRVRPALNGLSGF